MVTGRNWRSAAARSLIEISGAAPTTVENAIELVVRKILEGVEFPPTDLEAIAARMGVVQIRQQEHLAGSGELHRGPEGLEIVYSADLNGGRLRFTVAHELGHVFLASSGMNCSGSKELERLCDRIAAEMLMPADCFRRLWKTDFSIKDLFRIAKLFETSIAATATRCHELFGAAAFEVRDGSVSWRRGIPDSEIRQMSDAVKSAIRGEEVDERIYVRMASGGFAPFRLQGIRIAEKQSFFFATPVRQ
jgi:IrrE N-terminal-like domain